MNVPILSFLTVGSIARQLQVPLHRVEYAIRAHNITPIGRAGNARVFSEEDVAKVAQLLGVQPLAGSKE